MGTFGEPMGLNFDAHPFFSGSWNEREI